MSVLIESEDTACGRIQISTQEASPLWLGRSVQNLREREVLELLI
jgi:hypothetical protein